MRFLQFIFCLLFFVISITPVVFIPMFKEQENYDNRALAEFPAPMVDGKPNMDYPQNFEAWLSDHFAMRPYFLTAYDLVYYKLFGESNKDRVVAGKEDWLYFSSTVNDYTGQSRLTDKQIDDIANVISLCDEYVRSLGKHFIFFSAPNKNTIYPDYMPDRYLKANKPTNLERLNKTLTDNKETAVIDMRPPLLKAKSEKNIYHKKDSHWNNLGAKIGYDELMKTIQRVTGGAFTGFASYDLAETRLAKTHEGDLQTMFLPALNQRDEQVEYDIEENYYSVKPIIRYDAMEIETTSEANEMTALMFRDSFANALIPFMSNSFGEIKYSRILPYRFIEAENYDMVILEIVERNIPELLARAPFIPAPVRENAFKDTSEKSDGSATVFCEEMNELYYFYGFYETDNNINAKKIYMAADTGAGELLYEAFPTIDERLAEDLPENAQGFGLYLSEMPPENKVDIYSADIQKAETIKFSDILVSETPFADEE